jgi:hypothetical protein
MKYAIIIAMLAGSAMGQHHSITNSTYVEAEYMNTVTNVFDVLDIIKAAITNGTVCRVRGGHLWNDKWSGMESGWKSDGRQCQICNLYQKRKEVWEDEK